MRYISTRGDAPILEFDEVLLAGLAADGGLYVPETWPRFGADDFRAPPLRETGQFRVGIC